MKGARVYVDHKLRRRRQGTNGWGGGGGKGVKGPVSSASAVRREMWRRGVIEGGGQWRRRGCTEFIVALVEPSPAASLAEQGEAWAKG